MIRFRTWFCDAQHKSPGGNWERCQRSPCRHVPSTLGQWGPNRRAEERGRAAARAAAEAKRAEAERKAIAEAEKIVAIWNAQQAGGRALWFYPTIGAANRSRPPVAKLFLPGVQSIWVGRPSHTR